MKRDLYAEVSTRIVAELRSHILPSPMAEPPSRASDRGC